MSTILIILFVVIVLGGIAALIFMWVVRSGMFHSHLRPADDDNLVGHPDDLSAIEAMTSEAATGNDQANDQASDQASDQANDQDNEQDSEQSAA